MESYLHISISEINDIQTAIMRFIQVWVKEHKTPVPLQAIVIEMTSDGVKECTTMNAISSLLKKSYIRRAIVISRSTSYVQLRRI